MAPAIATAAISGSGDLTIINGGKVTLFAANSYSGNTRVSGGTLQVTGSLANNGSSKVLVTKDTDGVFGNANGDAIITRRVAATGTYAGLGSAITNLGTGELATAADILAGSASTQTDVSMAWRTRTAAEKTRAGGGLASEVLNASGVAISGSETHNGSHHTDTFVLQMSYDPAQLLSIWGLTEADAIAQGKLCLGYLDLGTDGLIGGNDDRWVRAVDGNFGGTPSFVGNHPYSSSYFVLGDYGVDTSNPSNHFVWAVLDHNSQFAVVPEPSSFALLAASFVGLLCYSRRRRMARRAVKPSALG